MSGFFFELGKKLRPTVQKSQLLLHSAIGNERRALEAEAKLGRGLVRDMGVAGSANGDPAMQARVSAIGQALTAQLRNQRRQFRFTVISADEPNAFAFPGGYVFITEPLIELVDAETDVLAFVLAHEIAHVVKKHAVERMMTGTVIGAAVRALPAARVAGNWIHSAAAKLLTSAYSQVHEFEADRFGDELSTASGYASGAGVELLGRLAQRHATDQTLSVPLAEYFAAHPPLSERIARLRRR